MKRGVKDRFLSHQLFVDCVKEGKKVIAKQNTIKSKKHSLGTYHQTKIAMTSYDTKRWIAHDIIHKIAHGHIKTQEEKVMPDWDNGIHAHYHKLLWDRIENIQ